MDTDPSALCFALSSDLAAYFAAQSYLNLPAHSRAEKAAASFNLQASLVAKLSRAEVGEELNAKAFRKWLSANEKCAQWAPPEKGVSEIDDLLWGELREAVHNFFWLDGDTPLISGLAQIAVKGSHGPGASNGVVGTSYYEKSFVGGMTTTSEILWEIYRQSYSRFPGYVDAVDYGATARGGPVVVEGCQEFYVPKNADITRLAATEPSLNMFFQKGAASLLEKRLVSVFGISLDVQPARNRRLAQLGSESGDFATIDLSSASDSVSHRLVKELVPRGVYDVLARIRSPFMARKGHEPVRLEMFSTMGNGFTFALETVLFACIVQAAYKVCGLRISKGVHHRYWDPVKGIPGATADQCANFAVFGDDIIVVKRAFPLVRRLLELSGFTLNSKKTFVEGPFRESCGGDYYNGHPVRGVYIKLLETREHVFHAVNSLVDWSTEHSIDVRRTVRYLLSRVAVKDLLYVPPHEQTDVGLHVPLEFFQWCRDNPLRSDPSLGVRFVYKASIPKVRRIRIRWVDIPGNITFIRLQADKGAQQNIVLNEAGLYQCFLAGHVRNASWSVRQKDPERRTSRKTCPHWGSRPGASIDWMGRWQATALRHII